MKKNQFPFSKCSMFLLLMIAILSLFSFTGCSKKFEGNFVGKTSENTKFFKLSFSKNGDLEWYENEDSSFNSSSYYTGVYENTNNSSYVLKVSSPFGNQSFNATYNNGSLSANIDGESINFISENHFKELESDFSLKQSSFDIECGTTIPREISYFANGSEEAFEWSTLKFPEYIGYVEPGDSFDVKVTLGDIQEDLSVNIVDTSAPSIEFYPDITVPANMIITLNDLIKSLTDNHQISSIQLSNTEYAMLEADVNLELAGSLFNIFSNEPTWSYICNLKQYLSYKHDISNSVINTLYERFPIPGEYKNTMKVTDISGNTAEQEFTITVVPIEDIA